MYTMADSAYISVNSNKLIVSPIVFQASSPFAPMGDAVMPSSLVEVEALTNLDSRVVCLC